MSKDKRFWLTVATKKRKYKKEFSEYLGEKIDNLDQDEEEYYIQNSKLFEQVLQDVEPNSLEVEYQKKLFESMKIEGRYVEMEKEIETSNGIQRIDILEKIETDTIIYELKINNITRKGIKQTIEYMKQTNSYIGHLVSFWKNTVKHYMILKEEDSRYKMKTDEGVYMIIIT